MSTEGLLECKHCVSNFICIVNAEEEVRSNIKVRASLHDTGYNYFNEYRVKIVPRSNLQGKAEYDIIIDELPEKNDKPISFNLLTQEYNEITYDWDVSPKQRSQVIKYQVGIPENITIIIKVFEKLGIVVLPTMTNEWVGYRFSKAATELNKIEDEEIAYLHYGGNTPCSTKNPATNPVDLI